MQLIHPVACVVLPVSSLSLLFSTHPHVCSQTERKLVKYSVFWFEPLVYRNWTHSNMGMQSQVGLIYQQIRTRLPRLYSDWTHFLPCVPLFTFYFFFYALSSRSVVKLTRGQNAKLAIAYLTLHSATARYKISNWEMDILSSIQNLWPVDQSSFDFAKTTSNQTWNLVLELRCYLKTRKFITWYWSSQTICFWCIDILV